MRPIALEGGNMNPPERIDNFVYKERYEASDTIHRLLNHVRAKGIDWVPVSHGFEEGKHVLSFIPGIVPHDTPRWLYCGRMLKESAARLRVWHDATLDFRPINEKWLLSNDEAREVICHNDFAPYNWVFTQRKRFKGLIDFDTCSPGSRLWDIAYTAYRIVPLMPYGDRRAYTEVSPFDRSRMEKRLKAFLGAYSRGEESLTYSVAEVLEKTQKRLLAIAEWSEREGARTGKKELCDHATMYRLHADWLKGNR